MPYQLKKEGNRPYQDTELPHLADKGDANEWGIKGFHCGAAEWTLPDELSQREDWASAVTDKKKNVFIHGPSFADAMNRPDVWKAYTIWGNVEIEPNRRVKRQRILVAGIRLLMEKTINYDKIRNLVVQNPKLEATVETDLLNLKKRVAGSKKLMSQIDFYLGITRYRLKKNKLAIESLSEAESNSLGNKTFLNMQRYLISTEK